MVQFSFNLLCCTTILGHKQAQRSCSLLLIFFYLFFFNLFSCNRKRLLEYAVEGSVNIKLRSLLQSVFLLVFLTISHAVYQLHVVHLLDLIHGVLYNLDHFISIKYVTKFYVV